MATKGAIWIWLTLLAIRGLTVFCFSMHYQQVYREQQESMTKETPPAAPAHQYSIHKVQAANFSFILLS